MIHIIKATEEHLQKILEIGQGSISPAWTYKMLKDELDKGDSTFYAAADNTVKGFIVIRKVDEDAEILQIAVDDTARRRGIGDMLMKAVLEYVQESNLKSIFLEVRSSNIAAVRLYKKHGFINNRVRKDYYNDPIEDATIMIRKTHEFI